MVKQLVVKTDCQGGMNCGLGISRHPIGPNKFALGCSLCRSEKLGGMNLANIAHANGGGFNLEKRGDMMEQYGHLNVNLADRMQIVPGALSQPIQAPNPI